MGINSTEVSYNFGQLGSGFQDTAAATSPPAGKVIVAMTFLSDTTFTTLVADTASGNDAAYFSHTAPVEAGQGVGSQATDSGTTFPAGMTIYGRWTSFTPNASADGGVIYYFGK